MEIYDIAIIGTGPAGISAAITSAVRGKKILLIGSRDLSMKLSRAPKILNYPGYPGISGKDLGEAFRKHLDALRVPITEARITAIYPVGDLFQLQSSSNELYSAKAVILAIGVVTEKPLPGELELLGKGVSYCATCDAPLYRGKKAVVVSSSPREETEADFLATFAEQVTYLPLYKDPVHLNQNISVISGEKPVSIEGTDHVTGLRTDGQFYPADGVFLLRESVAPGQLIMGLTMDGPHIKTDRNMATGIPGCFACGDITGRPYQYVKSAGEGNVAALSAVSYLDHLAKKD